MEELLNKLIEKGWRPFGALGKARNSVYTNKYFFFEGCADGVTLRQLVSKESGLWQFCVENKLVNRDWNYTREYVDENKNYILFSYAEGIIAEYYIIESALCNEEDLEKFLLDNIKV